MEEILVGTLLCVPCGTLLVAVCYALYTDQFKDRWIRRLFLFAVFSVATGVMMTCVTVVVVVATAVFIEGLAAMPIGVLAFLAVAVVIASYAYLTRALYRKV
jgi:hypothetical protein